MSWWARAFPPLQWKQGVLTHGLQAHNEPKAFAHHCSRSGGAPLGGCGAADVAPGTGPVLQDAAGLELKAVRPVAAGALGGSSVASRMKSSCKQAGTFSLFWNSSPMSSASSACFCASLANYIEGLSGGSRKNGSKNLESTSQGDAARNCCFAASDVGAPSAGAAITKSCKWGRCAKALADVIASD